MTVSAAIRCDDVLDRLLDPGIPVVRAAALRRLPGRADNDPDLLTARAAAMRTDPIAAMPASQHPEGWWVHPGPGYGPKCRGAVRQLVFLEQLGADGDDDRVRRAVDYVLRWCPTSSGGLGASSSARPKVPPPSSVAHCLDGKTGVDLEPQAQPSKWVTLRALGVLGAAA